MKAVSTYSPHITQIKVSAFMVGLERHRTKIYVLNFGWSHLRAPTYLSILKKTVCFECWVLLWFWNDKACVVVIHKEIYSTWWHDFSVKGRAPRSKTTPPCTLSFWAYLEIPKLKNNAKTQKYVVYQVFWEPWLFIAATLHRRADSRTRGTCLAYRFRTG